MEPDRSGRDEPHHASCTFGDLRQEECHKKSYTRQRGLKPLCDLQGSFQEELLRRADLQTQVQVDSATICLHHELQFGRVFERMARKCCDIFSKHKSKVAGDRNISLELAKQLEEGGYNVKPGWKLCRNCEAEAKDSCEVASSTPEFSQSPTGALSQSDEEELELAKEKVNTSLHMVGVSPIKSHGLSKNRKISLAKEKLSRAFGQHQENTATMIGVEVSEIQQETIVKATEKRAKQKDDDFDKLLYCIKEKLKESNHIEKTKILTLTPESWSRKYAADFFGVSEYLIRKARSLKAEKGILSVPGRKAGRSLSKEVQEKVERFYEDDEYSRLMPGKKDCISVARNIHRQKRLLLCNLHELFVAFKERHPETMIGFSKFCSLRPKWCVTVGSPGTHTVCVCSHHQNTALLVNSLDLGCTYNDLIKRIVCDDQSRECMVDRCRNCPGASALRNYLEKELKNLDESEIMFHQWQSTDRPTLVTRTAGISEFLEMVVDAIDRSTEHSYIAKSQARRLKTLKEDIGVTSCIVLLDFAENYKYVVQDEVQSFHWNNTQCTLHPVVIYYKDGDDKLMEASICMLSEDMNHDTCFVYETQRLTTDYIKHHFPEVKTVHYFSDGCGAQYKNFKNFLNLCHHGEDFGLDADWTFFATSHGKSPCDGVGGTVKRVAARASLQRPLNDQILSVDAMYTFCKASISAVHFENIPKDRMAEVRKVQFERFKQGQTVPGTRSYHCFEPIPGELGIRYKRTSDDPNFIRTFRFQDVQPEHEPLQAMQYVACKYSAFWWIGLVTETNDNLTDANILFMLPHGPTKRFFWPSNEAARARESAWVPYDEILCKIEAPTTINGRTYIISNSDFEKICAKCK